MTENFSGIGSSDGVAIAKAYLLVEPELDFNPSKVDDTQEEIKKLDQALEKSIADLRVIRSTASEKLGEEEAQVFDAHIMVLSDPEMLDQVRTLITDQNLNAESSFDQVTANFINMFQAMEDNPYMQERASDIKDVKKRVLGHLLGVTLPDLTSIDHEVVIVAHDLTPSDTAQLDKKFVKGFVTNIGGRTSHSAIMARSLEIPAVVGVGDITSNVSNDQVIILDGETGKVLVDPSDQSLEEYQAKASEFQAQKAEWAKLLNEDSLTKDGKQVELAANIGTPADLEGAISNGAEAIGLYRTEFLYMDSDQLPTEEEQEQAYRKVLEGMEGRPVVVRTMDIGGDKHLPYLDLPEEMNPFLGYRAIRISLDQDEIFRTQLRALLKASTSGNLRIMFPMIANVSEFRQAKEILEEERKNLIDEGVEIAKQIQLGIMVEIPAAAVLADHLAKEVDFFSIGTNDLIQYTMAADRMNQQVSYLYQPYHPSILRLINHVIQSAHKEGKWVGMCGEMAGDQTAVPLLVGMGLDEFSMSPVSILKTRSLLKSLDSKEMEKLAAEALEATSTAEEVVELVEKYRH